LAPSLAAAMFASLTKALGSFATSAFPYTLGEKWPTAWGGWEHYKGTAHEDSARVSIFKITAPNADAPRMAAARNGVKRLKLLRHPNLLAFKASYETTEKGQAVLYIVTQAVQPLQVVLQELDLQGEHKWVGAVACVHGAVKRSRMGLHGVAQRPKPLCRH
jgi:SCY1-like protein 1